MKSGWKLNNKITESRERESVRGESDPRQTAKIVDQPNLINQFNQLPDGQLRKFLMLLLPQSFILIVPKYVISHLVSFSWYKVEKLQTHKQTHKHTA